MLAVTAAFFYFRNRRQMLADSADPERQNPADDRPVIEFSRYVCGLPGVEDVIFPCLLYFDSDGVQFCKYQAGDRSKILGIARIPLNSISEIRVEDLFNMKRKIQPDQWNRRFSYLDTITRNPDQELAFLVIEWDSGIRTEYTYLSLEGEFAMEMAVKKRNALMRMRRQELLLQTT